MAQPIPPKIDVHSHFLPPSYREACYKTGHGKPDGMPMLPEWSTEAHLVMAKQVNIQKSIISISSPGIHLVPGDEKSARQLCRDCNTYAADLKRRMPEQFGFWATIPLPDIEGSLAELAYALDELDADGIAVETNHHGYYLGDVSFEPVWAELNRRHAIVFIHPTCPYMRETLTHPGQLAKEGQPGVTPSVPLPAFPRPVFEFLFDTARAVINLFYSGNIARYQDITYIIPHAGGALPPMIERFSLFGRAIPGMPVDASVNPKYVKERLRKQFYFDMAGAPFPDQMHGLMRHVDVGQILYGSDYPFTPVPQVKMLAESIREGMEKGDLFKSPEEAEAAYYGNAMKLLEKKR